MLSHVASKLFSVCEHELVPHKLFGFVSKNHVHVCVHIDVNTKCISSFVVLQKRSSRSNTVSADR